ncbi:ABC transporter substrate-binding protein [Mesorhizobium sp. 1B3]|uniref:ABC transporter substrate-binding protein n=1 Tax=Mesorhizobium sp. 1B3 TaxID=3243599 RepID=UPI003D992114
MGFPASGLSIIHPIPLLALVLAALAGQPAFAVTVESCGREVTIKTPPRRAASYGSNLTEIMLALGLEDRMAGFFGQGERIRKQSTELFPGAAGLAELQGGYPTLEAFLDNDIDFYFAGWSYGMRVGGDITPEALAAFGIPVYELSESCIRLGRAKQPSFEYLYRDVANLAAIFDVADRAAALIHSYEARLAAVTQRLAGVSTRPTVFIYDSGEKVAVSAGGYSMPQAIIDAAGGANILADVESSWIRAEWETVVDRNPSAIVVVDYGNVTAEQKIAFLKSNPAFAAVEAIRQDRFLVLGYDDLTPGPRNVSAVERLAGFLHGN